MPTGKPTWGRLNRKSRRFFTPVIGKYGRAGLVITPAMQQHGCRVDVSAHVGIFASSQGLGTAKMKTRGEVDCGGKFGDV